MSSVSIRRRVLGTVGVLVLAVAAPVAGSGSASATATSNVCTGGEIASGSYAWLSIKGDCTISDDATVNVKKILYLAPGAVLNAVSLATVRVGGNVYVSPGAILGLGCTIIGVGCSANSDVAIGGNIVLHSPLTMFLDGIKVGGNVISTGGGPGSGVTADNIAYNFVFKDNVVGGAVRLTGWHGGWAGAIRNTVGHNLVFSSIKGNDPDSSEIVHNTVGGNLVCWGNSPKAQFGDAVTGSPPGYAQNVVGGHTRGQCKALV